MSLSHYSRKPSAKVFIAELPQHFEVAAGEVGVAGDDGGQLQAVEHRVFADRVLRHVAKDEPVADDERFSKLVLANNIPR